MKGERGTGSQEARYLSLSGAVFRCLSLVLSFGMRLYLMVLGRSRPVFVRRFSFVLLILQSQTLNEYEWHDMGFDMEAGGRSG